MAESPESPWLARWRSWVDPEAREEGSRNLWDEFFALLHRREMWQGYSESLERSPKDASHSARYLTQWILRNHVESQAVAIRRISDRSTQHKDTIAFGRLLDEIAAHPDVLGDEISAQAAKDADRLEAAAQKVRTFATKVVAHFDRDHSAASKGVTLGDFDTAIDLIADLWQTWYSKVTNKGVAIHLPGLGWSNVVRLHRRDPSLENPEYVAGRLIYEQGADVGRDVLRHLERPGGVEELIGRFLSAEETRWLAELLLEGREGGPDAAFPRDLAEVLRRMLG